MKQGRERFIPLTKEIKDLIVMYREKHNLSYRAIEKKLDVSRETARLTCLDRIPNEKEMNKKRRETTKKRKVVNKVAIRKKKPLPVFNSVRDYDFLQYIRVVFKWALSNHENLNRGRLEMLLYLYPKGAFTYAQFHKYYKLIGMYQSKALIEFIKNGYIKVWRMPKKGEAKLYTLTEKGKKLCDDMHKYCTGEKKLPTDNSNRLTTDKSKRNNNYFMDMIIDMNKR
tara:strand:- start:449 stop:1126 length:678 start_codon:yes stop_codon:yes gene_type:complete